jgi:uncharacterized Zn-finger protein
VCEKRFHSRETLKSHESRHNLDSKDQAKMFFCPTTTCGRGFDRDEYLQAHIRKKHEGTGRVTFWMWITIIELSPK